MVRNSLPVELLSQISQIFKAPETEIDAPRTPLTKWIRCFYIIFALSFVFDYKAPDIGFGSDKQGGSMFQFLFLGMALGSGFMVTLIGYRHLLVRPGIYMVLLWWGYVAFMVVAALAQGNEFGRMVRLLVSPLLVALSVTVTHVAASSGMRIREIILWFLGTSLINILWKFGFGLLGSEVTINDVRMGILSPAMRFVFAWIACALILRPKFTFWIIFVLIFPMIPSVYSITRSIALPIAASMATACFCLCLGILWKMYSIDQPIRKAGTVVVAGLAAVLAVVVMAMIQPQVIDRWVFRMVDNGSGATSEDLSALMRKAEAKSMLDILSEDPETFIYGKGLGAAYYWDESYFPELFLVYPEDRHQFNSDAIYTAGHSVWTYTLFSSGIIGVCITLGSFFFCAFLSVQSAYMNSKTVLGRRSPDSYIMFLPFAAMMATLSESITRNPFDERFTGILFGLMLGLPQFFYNRAYYLKYQEEKAESVSQLILNETDVPAGYGEVGQNLLT